MDDRAGGELREVEDEEGDAEFLRGEEGVSGGGEGRRRGSADLVCVVQMHPALRIHRPNAERDARDNNRARCPKDQYQRRPGKMKISREHAQSTHCTTQWAVNHRAPTAGTVRSHRATSTPSGRRARKPIVQSTACCTMRASRAATVSPPAAVDAGADAFAGSGRARSRVKVPESRCCRSGAAGEEEPGGAVAKAQITAWGPGAAGREGTV